LCRDGQKCEYGGGENSGYDGSSWFLHLVFCAGFRVKSKPHQQHSDKPGKVYLKCETYAGTTQRAAVDYAIERSGFRDFFPGFADGRGTPAARLAAARRFSRLAILYLVARLPLMPEDAAK
jgi:hypothetical protein